MLCGQMILVGDNIVVSEDLVGTIIFKKSSESKLLEHAV